jgi:hypothetical protein
MMRMMAPTCGIIRSSSGLGLEEYLTIIEINNNNNYYGLEEHLTIIEIIIIIIIIIINNNLRLLRAGSNR